MSFIPVIRSIDLPSLSQSINGLGSFFSFLSSKGILTVIGWILVFMLGLKASKIQQRNAARLEIYKELYQLKLKIDKDSVSLGLLLWEFAPPFMYMDWAEKGSPTAEGKKPYELWMEYNKQIISANSEFSENYQKFYSQVNMWITVMPELRDAKNILFKEFSSLSDAIWEHVNYLREVLTNESDWKKWNQEEIKTKAKEIREKYDQVAVVYLNDFMDCVHDELIAPIFNQKKIVREDFNYKKPIVSKTLTKEGIKEIKYEARVESSE
jgi:hypothetical protein